MFDTYITKRVTEDHYHRHDIHEHRAPTDESVKLLNEMMEKAKSNLISTFSTSNNTLQATWAVYEDMTTNSVHYLLKCVINGKEHLVNIDVKEFEIFPSKKTLHTSIQTVYEKLCKIVTAELMQNLLEEMKTMGGVKWK